MTTDIQSLTGPALSASVATEVMGWHTRASGNIWWDAVDCLCPVDQWVPHSEIEQAREVIAEIQRRGLMQRLQYVLWNNWCKATGLDAVGYEDYLLTVPPSDICRAALRVVREAKQ